MISVLGLIVVSAITALMGYWFGYDRGYKKAKKENNGKKQQ